MHSQMKAIRSPRSACSKGKVNSAAVAACRSAAAIAKAFAFIYERDFATPEDVKNAAVPVLAHRIILSPQGKSEFGTGEAYIRSVISSAPVPAM